MAKKKDAADQQEMRQPTNEEQMQIRQSAPKPTVQDELMRQQDAQMARQVQQMPMQPSGAPGGAVDGFVALSQPIGKEAVQKAAQILQKYKEGKTNLDQRIIDNEQWYRLRHWELLRHEKDPQVQPVSGWLFNSIANKHADAMDSYPSPNILPREEGDKGEAEMLTSIVPVILEQNDFEAVYSDMWDHKLIGGTGVYGVFWDSSKLHGLGDIAIKSCDLLELFWEPGITDIQDSRNLFNVELVANEALVSEYPQLQGKLGSKTLNIAEYIYDDSVDTTDHSVVVDWYYKKTVNGKKLLHFCKFVNDEVLFATENNPKYAEAGLYAHGKYPFLFDRMYVSPGTPAGFGFIDVGKSAQEYIDRGDKAIMQNMLANTKPRHFIRNDGNVNEEEYADMNKDFIHVNGQLGQDSIMPVQGKPLAPIYVQVIDSKINELKETTGNRDVATGGSTGGVTAASGIAAMQEASSKLQRSHNRASFRCFRELCLMVIELIRQFYDMPRCFRIMGQDGMQRFVQYSNAGIAPQPQGVEFGVDMGMRIPLFDIEVSAQKQSPYSKMAQNELALQFYNAGFFEPTRADQALACLDMMDFPRKEFIMQKIQQNGGMLQQMMMLAQMADNAMGTGGEISMGIAQQYGLPVQGGVDPEAVGRTVAGEGADKGQEATITKNARKRVAEASSPT